MASMNSSGPMKSSPVSGSLTALLLNRALMFDDHCTVSSEPIRLSFTASLTVVEVGAILDDSILSWPEKCNQLDTEEEDNKAEAATKSARQISSLSVVQGGWLRKWS